MRGGGPSAQPDGEISCVCVSGSANAVHKGRPFVQIAAADYKKTPVRGFKTEIPVESVDKPAPVKM